MYERQKAGDEKAVSCLYWPDSTGEVSTCGLPGGAERRTDKKQFSWGAVTVAAYGGNLPLVRMLVDAGHYVHVRACHSAAQCGHVSILA